MFPTNDIGKMYSVAPLAIPIHHMIIMLTKTASAFGGPVEKAVAFFLTLLALSLPFSSIATNLVLCLRDLAELNLYPVVETFSLQRQFVHQIRLHCCIKGCIAVTVSPHTTS